MTTKNNNSTQRTHTPLSLPMLQLYLLSMLFFTSTSILTITFPLQATENGISEGEIGVMMGVYMFVSMLLRPWTVDVFTVICYAIFIRTSVSNIVMVTNRCEVSNREYSCVSHPICPFDLF